MDRILFIAIWVLLSCAFMSFALVINWAIDYAKAWWNRKMDARLVEHRLAEINR